MSTAKVKKKANVETKGLHRLLRVLLIVFLFGVFCYQCWRSFVNLLDPGVATEQSEEYVTKVIREYAAAT